MGQMHIGLRAEKRLLKRLCISARALHRCKASKKAYTSEMRMMDLWLLGTEETNQCMHNHRTSAGASTGPDLVEAGADFWDGGADLFEAAMDRANAEALL